MFKRVNSFMKNIRHMGQEVLTNTASFDSNAASESQDDASEQNSCQSEEEINPNNQSLLSYMEHANDKSSIGENNLKLNIVANAFLLLANLLLFQFDWYVHREELYDVMHPEGRDVMFYFSIFTVTIAPSNTQMSISDF